MTNLDTIKQEILEELQIAIENRIDDSHTAYKICNNLISKSLDRMQEATIKDFNKYILDKYLLVEKEYLKSLLPKKNNET